MYVYTFFGKVVFLLHFWMAYGMAMTQLSSLEYIADTVISVEDNSKDGVLLDIAHRIPGGKLVREKNLLRAGTFTIHTANRDILQKEKDTCPPPLPSSTFNLELTSQQAAAKANVLLPHLRVQLANASLDDRSILAADFDEEDPDDDLDI